MINKNILDVLEHIYKRLQGENLVWCITGSCNFALQGMSIITHDIDIQTDEESAYKIQYIFKDNVIKPVSFSSTGRIRSHFGELDINSVKVEIMGDLQKILPDGKWEECPDLKKEIHYCIFNGLEYPVLPLEYEVRAYTLLGRNERAEQIRKYIERNKK
jgi:hypothetical protein